MKLCRLLLALVGLALAGPALAIEATPLSAAGATAPIRLDLGLQHYLPPGIFVTFANSTTASCTVQATADAAPSSSSNWLPADPSGSLTGLTASTTARLAAAATALRLNCASLSAGSVTFGVAQ